MGSQVGLLACVATCCFASFSEHVFAMASAQIAEAGERLLSDSDRRRTLSEFQGPDKEKPRRRQRSVATSSHPRTLDNSTSKVGLFICTAHPGLTGPTSMRITNPTPREMHFNSQSSSPQRFPRLFFHIFDVCSSVTSEPNPEGTCGCVLFGTLLRHASTCLCSCDVV